ncbi:hypothetical protein AVEN_272538-1 [Araneus ventricosus]|uniref:Uncharacterized protein n=1 Tax=Araneus ventricosus TaxID=182803 RepID=A0A4Y2EBY9_ARAVE|nr:hypothetical protein AVEN_272538-1 [Araneus ventricosus]
MTQVHNYVKEENNIIKKAKSTSKYDWAIKDDVTKLYYAAYKYKIEKPKLLCTSFLAENLSTSNALLLADTHSDADLKKFVEVFILGDEERVFVSDEWEKVMGTSPQLGMKTMLLKYKRK